MSGDYYRCGSRSPARPCARTNRLAFAPSRQASAVLRVRCAPVCAAALMKPRAVVPTMRRRRPPKRRVRLGTKRRRRYLAEVKMHDQEVKASSKAAYEAAKAVADTDLQPTHPIRLGLALNYSVFMCAPHRPARGSCSGQRTPAASRRLPMWPNRPPRLLVLAPSGWPGSARVAFSAILAAHRRPRARRRTAVTAVTAAGTR